MSSNYKDHLYALVLAGGGGTRLWPRSRNATPKQFLKLYKDKTFTQGTLARLNKHFSWDKIFIVTGNKAYKDEILREVPKLIPENILTEPMRRDTAAAHALGAAFIRSKDPKAVIVNEAADHIEPPEDYYHTVDVAAQAAFMGDWLVAIGIKPHDAHTGYGYIRRGDHWKTIDDKIVYELDKFTEKPELGLAKRFLHSGKYYWNANHYVWTADAFLNAIKKHAPKTYHGIETISKHFGKGDEQEVIAREYKKMPKISVDYAIAEKAKNFLLVTTDYRWIDIGNWNEVWENLPKDKNGNVIIDGNEAGGDVINIDTSDALIHKDGRMIAVVGVNDILIVDTKDALLVVSKESAQKVKKVVQKLRKDKKDELL